MGFEIPSPIGEKKYSPKDPYEEYGSEKNENKKEDYYSMLRRELDELKKGGSDIHFSMIEVDNLSKEALELYRKHKRKILEEDEIRNFQVALDKKSDDYQFSAMLLNWNIVERINNGKN